MDAWFKADEGNIALLVAQVPAPQGLSIGKFSRLVSKDPRIPPVEQTKSVNTIKHTTRDDFKGMPFWYPLNGYQDTLGCALIPAMLFADGTFCNDVFIYGFQGRKDGIYIAGLYDVNPLSQQELRVVTAGPGSSQADLESSVREFLSHTGLSTRSIHESEIEELESIWPKTREVFTSHSILENGYLILIPFLLLSARQGGVMANKVELLRPTTYTSSRPGTPEKPN